MNPSADPPAVTQPPNHVATAAAADPAPGSYGVVDYHNQLSYPEMITAAIIGLNETKGSSRQAIAKYMEKAYANLPQNHSVLLTHNLKQMKNTGHLFMFKHSYLLSRSVPLSVSLPTTEPVPATEPVPIPIHPPSAMASPSSSAGPKRGRGRPPKPKPESSHLNFASAPEPCPEPISVFASETLHSMSVAGNGNGAGPSQLQAVVETGTGSGFGSEPEAMFVSLGLVDVPTSVGKRGRGRPPKAAKVTGDGGSVVAGGSPAVVTMRARGRRPKPKSITGHMIGQAAGGVLKKRGRGRPPRSSGSPLAGGGIARTRGRPRKSSRPRGRPAKIAGGAVAKAVGGPVGVPVGGSGVLAPRRGRGRGRLSTVSGGVKKPRKLSGRPLGRPRKSVSNAVEVSIQQHQQLMTSEDLKSKLAHVQTRIKHALSVLKPYLNSESAADALGALQELETIATMDVSLPINVPVHEPPPPPQNPIAPFAHVPEPPPQHPEM